MVHTHAYANAHCFEQLRARIDTISAMARKEKNASRARAKRLME